MAALRSARVMTEGELPPRSPLTEEEQCILTTLDDVTMQTIVGVDTAEPHLTAWREQPPRTPFTQVEPRVLQGLIGIDTADPHLLTASRTAQVLSCEVLPVKEEQTASLSPVPSPAHTPLPAPSPPHTHRDTSLIQNCPKAEALHSPSTSPSPPPSPARPACPPGQLAANPSELLVQVIEAQSLLIKPLSQVTKRGKPRQRAPRFNHKENNLLVKEVVNNKKELLGNLVLKPSQRKRKWERIAQKVSALGYHRRRAADIQKRFYDLRRAVRTKLAALRCARVMTEGELYPRSPLTEEEQCILTTLDDVTMQAIVGMDTAEPHLTASSQTAQVLSCEVLPVKEEQTASLSPPISPAQTPSPAPRPPHTHRDMSLIQNCPKAEALHSPSTSPSPPPSPARASCPPGQLAADASELLVQLLAAQRDGNSGQACIVRILASMKEQQAQQLGVLQSLAEKQSHMVERHEALEQRLGEISSSLNQLVAGLLPTLQVLSSAAQGLHTPVSQPCPPPAPDC
ncbi:TSNA1 protein, partial [Polyodon spathula]|nr:TSNA1 protein [Polyodon spathula]